MRLEAVVVNKPVLVEHAGSPARLDLLVAATIVTAEVSGRSGGRGKTGQSHRSAGKRESDLFHFLLHQFTPPIGVERKLDPGCRTTIGDKAGKLSQIVASG